MKLRIFFFLFLSFIFASEIVQAQLHVVKDNLGCTYGLKNNDGKWVIEPNYTLIHGDSLNGFIANDGLNYGFLSNEGKIVIPFEYPNLWLENGILITSKNEKIHFYSNSGEQILENVYDSYMFQKKDSHETGYYNEIYPYLFAYKQNEDSTFLTTCMNLSNREIYFKDVPGHFSNCDYFPFAIIHTNSDYLMDEYGSYSDLGVVDTSGRVIVPKIYNEIEFCDSIFTAWSNMKISRFNKLGQKLFSDVSSCVQVGGLKCDGLENTYIIEKEGKFSLVDNAFHPIIIEGTYDKIESVFSSQILDSGYCRVHSKNKIGIMNGYGKIILPLIYDDLIILGDEKYSYSSSENRSYVSSLKWIILYKLNGKYGLMNSMGERITEPIYDYSTNYYQQPYNNLLAFYLFKEGQLFKGFIYDPVLRLVELLFKKKELSFYKDLDKCVIVQNGVEKDLILTTGISIKGNLIEWTDPTTTTCYNQIYVHSSEEWHRPETMYTKEGKVFQEYSSPTIHLCTQKGKELFKGRVRYSAENSYGFTVVYLNDDKVILINSSSGDLIIDSNYSQISIQWKKIWAKSILTNKWCVFDFTGKLLSTTSFDQPIFNFYTFYADASSNGLKGICDTLYNWIIPPEYLKIQCIGSNYFVVVSKGNHIGAVDFNNKLIIDTVFTSFYLVFSNHHFCLTLDKKFDSIKPNYSYLFSDKDQRTLIDQNGVIISSKSNDDGSSKEIDRLLYKFAMAGEVVRYELENGDWVYKYDFIPDGSQNLSDYTFKIILEKEQKSRLQSLDKQKRVYELLRQAYMTTVPVFDSSKDILGSVKTIHSATNDTMSSKKIEYVGDYTVTLKSNYRIYKDKKLESSKIEFDNYLFEKDTIRNVSIEQVFGSQSILKEELIRSISKRDDLFLDCTSSDGILKLIENRFCLTSEGILLYIENHQLHDDDFYELLVPTERLALHYETKWIIPYLK